MWKIEGFVQINWRWRNKRSIYDLEKDRPIYNLPKTLTYLTYLQYPEVEDQSFQINRLGTTMEKVRRF